MNYTAVIKKTEGSYLVTFPDIPSVNTYGETLNEALDNAQEALNGCLESDFERGYKLPEARKKKYPNSHAIEVAPHISLAYQLRKARNGMSQSQIAKKLGISYQAYQKLENPRKCNPTVKTLEMISEVFGKHLVISLKS
ncbi:MAG TPA: type II toxin-antitoxin system HicB family antitoxin [Candidatus Omnitrophota bacterium]|nr:type II toxin-antitoxin system HicB family antitoxin [Candidatus Omnitrophota bacterium]